MEEAVRRCKNLTAQLKRRKRMVAYCRSKADCEELARELNCGLFYAGNPNNPEALKRWLAEGGMIVATTTLGTGMSYPGVMLVTHVGFPFELVGVSQQSEYIVQGEGQVAYLWYLSSRSERRVKSRSVSAGA
jgi:superfamily II DNA helicase RecQ